MGSRVDQIVRQAMEAVARQATVSKQAMEAVARQEVADMTREAVAMKWDLVIINRPVEVLRGRPTVVEAVKVRLTEMRLMLLHLGICVWQEIIV